MWVNDPALGKAVLVERGTGCVVLGLKGKAITAKARRLSAKPAINQAVFLQHLKHPDVENFVPHMYRDDKGNVTVGIGQLLPTVAATQMLAFTRRGTTIAATPQEIANDFNNVRSATLSLNTRARAYRNLTALDFAEPLAEQLAVRRMNEFVRLLRQSNAFPEFDTYPPNAKMGVLDLSYTLGVTGTKKNFPQFTAAVHRRNWKYAAFHSNRPQVLAQRNRTVRGWLDNAARQEPFFISHTGCRKQISAISR